MMSVGSGNKDSRPKLARTTKLSKKAWRITLGLHMVIDEASLWGGQEGRAAIVKQLQLVHRPLLRRFRAYPDLTINS